jgi:CARDB protein/List-Bact-rpt repeat protein
MVKRSALVALALLVAWPAPAHAVTTALTTDVATDVTTHDSAAGRPGRPRAELKMRKVAAAYADGQVTVTFTLENRGTRSAKATQTWIASLHDPTKVGPQDVGYVATPAIRSGHSKTLTATFPADHVPSGDVRILACADYARAVKQRNTQNDCKYTPTIVLPPEVVVTYGVNDRAAGAVAGTSTRGYCVGFGGAFSIDGSTGFCTVRPGGTVTLTASPAPGYVFASWAAGGGKTCAGTASGSQISFADPTTAQFCLATFAPSP